MKVVGFHQSALSRQVGEAVRISRRGGEAVLNSKSEFSRCKISRLTLEPTYSGEGNGEAREPEDKNDWTGRLFDKRQKSSYGYG